MSAVDVRYVVSIYAEHPQIHADERLEIRLTGPGDATKWIALSSKAEWNTIETFEFDDVNIGQVDEVSIRLRPANQEKVFDRSMRKFDVDIGGIFISMDNLKHFSFTQRDEHNEDYKTAYFLPGALYKFEITTLNGRTGANEIDQTPTVQVLYEQQHTPALILSSPVGNGQRKPFTTPGVDVFIMPSMALPKIDGLVVTNTKENYPTRWKIDRIACYVCHLVRENKLVWDSGIYWADLVLRDNILYTSCDESEPEGPVTKAIKRVETLRLQQANIKEKSMNEPLVAEREQNHVAFHESQNNSFENGFTTSVRSPIPSRPSTSHVDSEIDDTLADISNSDKDSQGTQTPDTMVEAELSRSAKTSSDDEPVPANTMKSALTKVIVGRSRDNMDIIKMEENKRLQQEMVEREARERVEEQKRKREEERRQQERLAELKRKMEEEKQRQLEAERVKREQLEREAREREEELKREEERRLENEKREREARNRADELKRERALEEQRLLIESERLKAEALAQVKPRPTSGSCSSLISVVGIHGDGTYTGRWYNDDTSQSTAVTQNFTSPTAVKSEEIMKPSPVKMSPPKSPPIIKTTTRTTIDLRPKSPTIKTNTVQTVVNRQVPAPSSSPAPSSPPPLPPRSPSVMSEDSVTEGAIDIREQFGYNKYTKQAPLKEAESTSSLLIIKENEEADRLRRLYKRRQLQLARAQKDHYMRKIEEMSIKEQELSNEASFDQHHQGSSLSSSVLSFDDSIVSEYQPVPATRTTLVQNTLIEDTQVNDQPPKPFARAKPGKKKTKLNTVRRPIVSPHFSRGSSRNSKAAPIFKMPSRSASVVSHTVLNPHEVVTEDKGIQAYFEDENIPIQSSLINKLSQNNLKSSNGLTLDQRIQDVKKSMEDIQQEIRTQKSGRPSEIDSEDEIYINVPKQVYVQNVKLDNSSVASSDSYDSDDSNYDYKRRPTAVINDAARSTLSTIVGEHSYEVSIMVKSCSYTKKKLEKYDLYIAIIGEKAQSGWAQLDTTQISSSTIFSKEVRAGNLGKLQAVRFLNPGSKILRSTQFDLIQVKHGPDTELTGEADEPIYDSFTVFQNSRIPDQIHFLPGVKYRLTVQTSPKWFSGTSEDVLMELIAERGVTNLIELKNKGSMANTNQKDQFDVSHEDIGDIIGVKIRLDYTPTKNQKKAKWKVSWMCAEMCRKIVPDELEAGQLVEVWERKREWQVDRSITLDQFFVGETTPTEPDDSVFNEKS